MKVFKVIAATAAVITCSIGNPIPAEASILIDTLSGKITYTNDGQMVLNRKGKRGLGLHTRMQDVSQPSFMGITRSDYKNPIKDGFDGQRYVVKMSPTMLNNQLEDFADRRGVNDEWVIRN